MRDNSDSVPSGPVDVVPERNGTFRCKNDVCKSPEPARALFCGKRFGYCFDDLSESSSFVNGHFALDLPNLPVDPVLPLHVWMKDLEDLAWSSPIRDGLLRAKERYSWEGNRALLFYRNILTQMFL
jgi:hypothetical protein